MRRIRSVLMLNFRFCFVDCIWNVIEQKLGSRGRELSLIYVVVCECMSVSECHSEVNRYMEL